MKKSYLIIYFLFFTNVIVSQKDEFATSKIFGTKFYHTFSVGFSLGGEHSLGLPKFSFGLQSDMHQGYYTQIHVASALGFTLSPGIEVGYRLKNIGVGYSISYLGIERNNRFYKWTHNINSHLTFGPVMGKIGTPIYYSRKGPEFNEYKYNFIEYKKTPLNLEINYFEFSKTGK